MSDRYPHAKTVNSRWAAVLVWGRLPPGSRTRHLNGVYLFFDHQGRYLAKDGVWRTPKEDDH